MKRLRFARRLVQPGGAGERQPVSLRVVDAFRERHQARESRRVPRDAAAHARGGDGGAFGFNRLFVGERDDETPDAKRVDVDVSARAPRFFFFRSAPFGFF